MANAPGVISDGIPRTVDPNYTITTRDQALDLEKAFDKAFGPLSDRPEPKTEPEPEIKPAEPPAGEGRAQESEPPKEIEPKEAHPEHTTDTVLGSQEPSQPDGTAPTTTHPDDEPDAELDQLRLHPDSRPETVTVFKQIRGMLKTERKLAKELRERVEKSEKEATSLRGAARPVSDPEVQKELEDLRSFRTKHQIFDDTGYQQAYEAPVRTLFDDLINDIATLAPDQAKGQEWANTIKAAGPDRLDRSYWNEGVLQQCTDPLHRDRLTRKISVLLDAQDKRNHFRDQMASQPDAFDQFRQQQAADYWQGFSTEAEDEAKKIIPTLGEWAAPKDIALAKTTQERSAWETHNKAYKEFEDIFQKALTDAATQGPRGMTRIAVQAVLAEKYKRDNETLSSQLKKAQAELKDARDELNKIAGVRSKATQGSGASAAAKSAEKPKGRLGQSVEDAFAQHFGR